MHKSAAAGCQPAHAPADEEAKSSRKEATLVRTLLQGSPFLRVMDLEEGSSHVTELPDEIEEMVHLQYLGVRWRLLKKVPSSIGNLGKLQTLDVRGTLWKIKTLWHVLADGLIFPRSTGELKLMQTLETVTIHNNQEEHRRCIPSSGKNRSREQSGLRFLHRLGIVEMEKCERQDLQAVLMDLGYHLESLSLSGNPIWMDVLVGAMLSAAGARLRHVESLELDGELQLAPHNPREENLFYSCLPRHLKNLSRLVLRRTRVMQEFIHVVAKLPILADSHGFSSLTVLRIDTLDTLKRVVWLHSADSRRNEAIKPTFVDMDMATITKVFIFGN